MRVAVLLNDEDVLRLSELVCSLSCHDTKGIWRAAEQNWAGVIRALDLALEDSLEARAT